MAKTIYLASPYGFSAQQRSHLLPEFVAVLESLGAEVWEPFARNNQVDRATTGWAYQIGQRDVADVRASDAIFAIVNGTPPDEGVMVELGIGENGIYTRENPKREGYLAGQVPVTIWRI